MRWFAVLFALLVFAAPAAARKPIPNRFVVVSGGKATPLFRDYHRYQPPCWTADGSAILALRGEHHAHYSLNRIDPQTGHRKELLRTTSPFPPTLSANCTEFATDSFTGNRMDDQLAVHDITGGTVATIDFPGHRWLPIEGLLLSPDGAHLAADVSSGLHSSGLWIFDAHTGAAEQHVRVKGPIVVNDQAWSPDSTQVLYDGARRPGLRTLDVATGKVRVATAPRRNAYITNTGWLPDGGVGGIGLDDLQRNHFVAAFPSGARTTPAAFPISTFVPLDDRVLIGTAPKSRRGTYVATLPAPGKTGAPQDTVKVGRGVVHHLIPGPHGKLLVVLGFERQFLG